MTAVFLKIVNMSISAGWLVLAVLLFRALLRKAPKWADMALWGIVALRLICPFTVESPFSLVPSGETISPAIMTDASPKVYTGIPELNTVVNQVIQNTVSPAPEASATPLQVWIPVLAVIWAAGLALFLLYAAVSFWRLKSRLSTAVLFKDNIFLSENAASPFVLGIVRPRIYLPFKTDSETMACVIAHEQTHIRRKDHWWKPLGFLLLALHWFNPLIWLSYLLLCRDIELACDERVIRKLNHEQRADYSQALLACSAGRHILLSVCPLAFGEVSVKKRVKSIIHFKKPAFWVVSLSAAACLMIAICFLTNPQGGNYNIKIVVPAGSSDLFVYSHEEISPMKSQLVIRSGDGLGDTEVRLQPVEVKEERAYDKASYLTPGMPVKMDVEKGAWFKIGVSVQNPTDKDIEVYVNVENVEVRIADAAGSLNRSAAAPAEDETVLTEVSDSSPADSLDDAAERIQELLDIVQASPALSSNPGDYIAAHSDEWAELLSYGEYSVRYCFDEFLKGGQTGLKGHLMCQLCREIMESQGFAQDDAAYPTGQMWFDSFRKNAERLAEDENYGRD